MVFGNIDDGAKPIFNIDFLTSVRWISENLNQLFSSCIENFFNHYFKEEVSSTSVDMLITRGPMRSP